MDERGDPGAWASELAAALGLSELEPVTAGALLRLSREVAHATERLNAPLCAYVAGRHVQARVGSGVSESSALAEVEAAITRLLGERHAG